MLRKIFKQVHKKLRHGAYCVVGTKNFYEGKKLLSLVCDTGRLLHEIGFEPEHEIVRVKRKNGLGSLKKRYNYYFLINRKK